jgi:hypothetical protein
MARVPSGTFLFECAVEDLVQPNVSVVVWNNRFVLELDIVDDKLDTWILVQQVVDALG